MRKRVTRALIVGINQYADPRDNLRGCVNDALTMAKVVTEYGGFPRDDVRLLCDRRATTDNIRRRLEWLVDGAGPGSQLLFHYSGHGAQVRDRNGDELDDHLDEILCPHDLDWDDPLTDDELGDLIAALDPEVRLTMVLDCCHSGTGTRAFYKERGKAEERRLRHLTPPPDIGWRAAGGVDLDASVAERTVNMVSKRAAVRRFGSALTSQNVVLIAGCRSDQTSADAFIENDYRGALTYGVWKALEEADYNITYHELGKRAGEWLTRNKYEQVPQVEGRKDLLELPFLGLKGRRQPTFVTTEITAVPEPLAALEAAAVSVAAARALSEAHVVFVHGIGDHKPGYSEKWRQAFGPHLGIADEQYHEVVWDDVFDKNRQPGQRALSGGQDMSLREKSKAVDYEVQIRELLAARQEVLAAAAGGGATTRTLGRGVVRDSHDRGLFNWLVNFDEYIGDFAKYLASDAVRDRVDAKLQVVLEDLFATGAPVVLITHSWGTVVGHHTLRRLHGKGQVAIHCTLGSPLWMLPVRGALDFDRTRFAARAWLNVDAGGDLVGGRLGERYDVTSEGLNVDAPGRSPHGSYFVPGNVRVQRDLVAAYAKDAIEPAV